MKTWILTLASSLALLAGCSSPLALRGETGTHAGALSLTWLQPQDIEIILDGKRHTGAWSSRTCHTDSCRGIYRNLLKHHRRHIEQGQAVLTSADGGRLECTWVSHLPDLEGTCKSADGRVFRLTGE